MSTQHTLTADEIKRHFPGASRSLLAAAPDAALKPLASEVLAREAMGTEKLLRRRRRVMNKTEIAFSRLLEARIARGELVSFEFEGVTLRWGNDEVFAYSADFCAVESVEHVKPVTVGSFPHVRLIFYETKGGLIRAADWSRFKHARDNFPLYEFQLWQFKQREWTRLA